MGKKNKHFIKEKVKITPDINFYLTICLTDNYEKLITYTGMIMHSIVTWRSA